MMLLLKSLEGKQSRESERHSVRHNDVCDSVKSSELLFQNKPSDINVNSPHRVHGWVEGDQLQQLVCGRIGDVVVLLFALHKDSQPQLSRKQDVRGTKHCLGLLVRSWIGIGLKFAIE